MSGDGDGDPFVVRLATEPEHAWATLHLRATDFWAERHARIYAAILAAPAPADIVLVAAWLRGHGQLEAVGGLGYLTELLTHATVLSALPSHAAIVRAKSRTRQPVAQNRTRLRRG